MSRQEKEMQAVRQMEKEKGAWRQGDGRQSTYQMKKSVEESKKMPETDAVSCLSEWGYDCIRPMRPNARHVKRCHDPLRFAQVVPFDANDFQHGKPRRTEREHPVGKVYFDHSLVKFFDEPRFLRRAKKRREADKES
jgi:hypothetical protein